MPTTTRWFGWFLLILPLHMIEQLGFGLEELTTLKRALEKYYAAFASPNNATVVLVTVVATLVYLCIFGALVGGRARLVVLASFGVIGLSEAHHVIETLLSGRYTSGTQTSIPYIAVGVALCRAVVREWRGPASLSAACPGAKVVAA